MKSFVQKQLTAVSFLKKSSNILAQKTGYQRAWTMENAPPQFKEDNKTDERDGGNVFWGAAKDFGFV